MQVGVTKELVNDALAISDAWSSELDLRDLIEAELRASGVLNLRVDVVAVGKAAREMRRPRATCSQNTSNVNSSSSMRARQSHWTSTSSSSLASTRVPVWKSDGR